MLQFSRCMLTLCTIGVGLGCLISATASISQEANPPMDAKAVAKLWAPPKAPESEIETLQPNNPTLLVQHIKHKLSFGKLWQYYANRCGYEKSYLANKVHIEGGTGKLGAFYVDDEVTAKGERSRSLFIVKNSEYSLTVILEPVIASTTNITVIVIAK